MAGRLLRTRRRHRGSAIEGEKRTEKEKKRGRKPRGSGKEKGGRERDGKLLSRKRNKRFLHTLILSICICSYSF